MTCMHMDTGGEAPAVAAEIHTSTNPLQENGTLSLDVSKVRGVYLSAERERGWMAEGKRAA